MKRAEVFQDDSLHLPWVAQTSSGPLSQRDRPIRDRSDWTHHEFTAYFPTHQEALDAALAAVGLATPPEHREAP